MPPDRRTSKISFSNYPQGSDLQGPTLSAPIGARGILAGVRAPPPPHSMVLGAAGEPSGPSGPRMTAGESARRRRPGSVLIPVLAASVKDGGMAGTMSRGKFAGGRAPGMEVAQWISNVKAGGRREGSSGPGSGGDSGGVSRIGSKSRMPVLLDHVAVQAHSRAKERSASKDRAEEDPLLSLQEE